MSSKPTAKRIETMNDRIHAAFQRGFQARENGQDTLWNPFLREYFKAEYDAWREGWLRQQAEQIKAEGKVNA